MDTNKISNIKLINKTPFLNLYEVLFKTKKNNLGKWIVASRKNEDDYKNELLNEHVHKDDAVVIAAYHKDYNKLVLIKEYRVPINDYIYQLTAGLIDNDEDSFNAAKRELKEETGLNLLKIVKDKASVYASPGMTDESYRFIYCICDGEISSDFQEEDERIETILIDKNEAINILNSDKKIDVKAYLILQQFVSIGDKIFME